MAVGYLEALKKGPENLRTWIYENMPAEWKPDTAGAELTAVEERQGGYAINENFALADVPMSEEEDAPTFADFYKGMRRTRFVTVDVQKDHLWWVVREWVKGGDSGLICYGTCVRYSEIDQQARLLGCNKVFIDAGDGDRQWDIYQACLKFRFIPIQGVENQENAMRDVTINPKTGKKATKLRGGSTKGLVTVLRFRTSPFKHKLLKRINGEAGPRWFVYDGIERGYCEQVTSEEWTEEGWRLKEGITRNHLWDCEVYQMLAAVRFGYAEAVD